MSRSKKFAYFEQAHPPKTHNGDPVYPTGWIMVPEHNLDLLVTCKREARQVAEKLFGEDKISRAELTTIRQRIAKSRMSDDLPEWWVAYMHDPKNPDLKKKAEEEYRKLKLRNVVVSN